jgi:hypothetical protein
MLSIIKPDTPLAPEVQRKLKYLQMFALPAVLVLFVFAMVSFPMGYLPRWVFGLAVPCELFLALYVIRRAQSLRKP